MKESNTPADLDRWIVQLDVGTLSSQDRERMHEWLGQSTANRIAFAEASALWFGSGQAELRTRASDDAKVRRHVPGNRVWRGLMWGAAMMVGVVLLAPHAPHWWSAARFDYATAQGGPVEQATLPDHSQVWMAPASTFDFHADADSRTLSLASGAVWLDVAKDANRPFTVQTRFGSVEVTGTVFGVATLSDRFVVSVDEGSVAVTPDGSTTAHLGDGDSLDPAGKLSPGSVRYGTLGWKEGQMRFHQASLGQVISALQPFAEHRLVLLADTGHVSIATPGATLNGLTADASGFSGVVELSKAEPAISWIARQHGLRITSAAGWTLIH